jgi:phage tail P2-like protein
MIKIDDIPFLRLLPNFLQEEKEIQIIAQVIQEELDLINEKESNFFIYGNFEDLNEAILDELAYQWKTEGYEQTFSKEIKTKLVENSYIVRKTKGTKYAVETTIKDIHGDFELLEWPDYGGNPYCFKVVGTLSPTGDKLSEVYKAINMTKNERSYLDGIIVSSQWEGTNYQGVIIHQGIFEEIPFSSESIVAVEEFLGG